MVCVTGCELTKYAVMAQALEPLIEKDFCATPTKSLGAGKSFVDFVISGVNTIGAFLELEERISRYNGQPPVFYDLVYKAVVDSERNRAGKTINFGCMEAMFPVVVARAISNDAKSAIHKVKNVLKNTSKEDVMWEIKTRKFAWGKSGKEGKRTFPAVDAESIYEYYAKIIPIIERRGLRNHYFYNELLNGLPMVREFLKNMKEYPVFTAVAKTHNRLVRELGLEKSPGIVADYSCAAIFLYLMDHKSEDITWV